MLPQHPAPPRIALRMILIVALLLSSIIFTNVGIITTITSLPAIVTAGSTVEKISKGAALEHL